MRLDIILAADYANITNDGKLNVMGIFREIYAVNFPARHTSMHLVIRLRAELGEYGQKRTLIVKLQAPDGLELMQLSGEIEIPGGAGGRTPEVNAIFELKDLVFPHPGPYRFIAMIDKDYKGDLPIHVNKVEPTDQPG